MLDEDLIYLSFTPSFPLIGEVVTEYILQVMWGKSNHDSNQVVTASTFT